MVFKQRTALVVRQVKFENDVKMYGIQTEYEQRNTFQGVENDVKMYGIQTGSVFTGSSSWFENDVKMYGIQTR